LKSCADSLMNESRKIVEKVIRVLRQAQHERKFINEFLLCSIRSFVRLRTGTERVAG
jgi:hypothetical protein